ncbi:MAG: NUDIX hydrolase [Mycobacteriales bacterium]
MTEHGDTGVPSSRRRADDGAGPPRDLDHATLVARLRQFDQRSQELGDRRPAAVAVAVVVDSQGPGILVTRRAAKLRAHPGQWALPGGRIDEGEDAEAAALRELDEELGLSLGRDVVLGRLDDYSTRSGYRITPVVLWAGEVTDVMRPNPDEVASVHVAHAGDYDIDPMFASIPESPDPIIRIPMLGAWIHAPTAAVVYQFRELALHGRTTRVAHFEQPVFAWR